MKTPSIPRHELVQKIAKEAGLTNKAANTAIQIIFKSLHDVVAEQRSFVIPGVGTLTGRLKPERKGRDPRTGETIICKEKLVVLIKSYFKQ